MKSLNQLMGMPGESYSKEGHLIDHMLEFVHYFMLALFVGWTIFFLYTIWRFSQKRSKKANYHGVKSKASKHLEIGVVIVEIILLFGFAFPLWAKRVDFPEEGINVRAIGYQFGWIFHYTGSDGRFGRIDPKLIKKDKDLGVDPNDPFGWDDFTSTKLILPVNKSAIISVTSNDVLHNFALVKMRVAQDAIPGQEVRTWFTPEKTGSYEIICGQLCGPGHANMLGQTEIIEQEKFEKFFQDNSSRQLQKNKEKLEQSKKLEDLETEIIEL